MGWPMTLYDFRLRVNLAGYRFAFAEEVAELGSLPNGWSLRLRSCNTGTAISDSERIAIIGSSFDSEDAALQAARETRTRFLQWAVREDVGIDWGGSLPGTQFSDAGLAHFAQVLGGPVRPDKHGIDVYERDPALRFIALRVEASVGKNMDSFRTALQLPIQPLSRKQELAAEIFTSHHFDSSPRSRFLTLVTALESLLVPQERSSEAQAVVATLRKTVSESNLDQSTKASMKGTLLWFRSESIGQTGRKLVTSLLSGRQYRGKPPAKFFSDIYEVRSGIVHRGETPRDILDIANATGEFVRDLILASIQQGPSRTASKEEVATAAYLRWTKRMELAQENALDDWLAAERDLKS